MITSKHRPLLAVALMLAFAPDLQAQEERDLLVVNGTGRDIFELYVAPTNSEAWSPELLDEHEELQDGESFPLSRTNVEGCSVDVRVVYLDDDSTAVWRGVEICQEDTVVLSPDMAAEVAPAGLN